MNLTNLQNLFEQYGCKKIETDTLQPAEPFLNATGEAFRKNLFITESIKGEAICLRPEFTIPVCLSHKQGVQKYHYCGQVFRQQTGDREEKPREFLQAGVESFGEKDVAKADADVIELALQSVKELCTCEPLIVIGDPYFFKSLVTPLGLSNTWRDRLLRAFGDEKLLVTLLERMVTKPVETLSLYKKDSFDSLKVKVEEMMKAHGMFNVGGRSPEDVASRFLVKRDEDIEINQNISNICREFLNLNCKHDEVAEVFESFCKKYNLDFEDALNSYQERDGYLKNLDVPIRFSASFGRRLDYYSGFVFEIYDEKNIDKGPLAGGGRYDHLSEMLGGEAMPAVGFSLWLDRLGEVK